jgi:hypothetical protein
LACTRQIAIGKGNYPLTVGCGGLWSLVKNGTRGVYHNVGKHYLQTYLNEYSFRYNRRFDEQTMFISFIHQIEKRDVIVNCPSVIVEEPF